MALSDNAQFVLEQLQAFNAADQLPYLQGAKLFRQYPDSEYSLAEVDTAMQELVDADVVMASRKDAGDDDGCFRHWTITSVFSGTN